MSFLPKHVSYLSCLAATLAIAAFCAATRFTGNTSSAATLDLRASTTTEVVEETVTLSAADAKTWIHYDEWYSKAPYCGHPFKVGPTMEDYPGSIIAGYKHLFEKGTAIFGCPERLNWNYRGTVWFELGDIVAKAPPLHVYVKKATLKFKALDRECPVGLLIASKDWSKGYPDNELVPGDPFARIESCGREGCSIDVQTVVNNWVRGEAHGGYANHGFVIKGELEGPVDDNEVCMTRYADFSLEVTYTYERKEPVFISVAPQRPERPELMVSAVIAGGRRNVALAANGGVAVASSTLPPNLPSYTNDGDRSGKAWLDDTLGTFPDWIEVDFSGTKTIDEIDVITRQDDLTSTAEPALGQTFTLYGITAFDVQYWDGAKWIAVPGGSVTDNNRVWKQFTFGKISTARIRVLVNAVKDNAYSRVIEVEAWGK